MEMTHEDYVNRGGFEEVSAEKFSNLYAKAKRMIKSLVGTDIEDQFERGFISMQSYDYYLDALVSQIEYIHFVGFKHVAGINETQDVKIGNFSYSEGTTRGGAAVSNPQYSNQVYEHLASGGFIGGAVNVYGY